MMSQGSARIKRGLLGIAVLGFLLASSAQAQQVRDRASFAVDGVAAAGTSSAGEVSAWSGEVNVNHREGLDADGNTWLTVGIQHRYTSVASSALFAPGLSATVVNATGMQVVNETDTVVLNVRPGFFGIVNAGDVSSFRSNAFRLEGAALYSRVMNERFTLGAGIARGSNFGRVLVVPVIQAVYLISDRWMLDALLPARADLWYLPSPDWEFGLCFAIVGSQYAGASRGGYDEVRFAAMTAGLAARRRVAAPLFVQLDAGRTVSRRFELWSQDRLARDLEPAGAFLGRVSLTLRF